MNMKVLKSDGSAEKKEEKKRKQDQKKEEKFRQKAKTYLIPL